MNDGVDMLEQQDVAPWMIDAVRRLARDKDRNLDAHLLTVGQAVPLDNTGAICRCHFVTRDGNGRPQVDKLARRLADQAVDYCIPRTRVQEAYDHMGRTRSAEKILGLEREAKELFTHLENSGEGGELLLYLLLELGMGIPQLLCKMPLKTNPEVHYHGVDGVHGKVLDNGNLALYWCESKLYDDVAGAIRDCFDSLAPFLLDDGGGTANRDLLLVRDHLDTGDPVLTDALKRFLVDDSVESTKLEIRGACLVGFSLEHYPEPFVADGVAISEQVSDAMNGWHAKIAKRIGTNKLESFDIEVFCVPLPAVATFRAALRKRLGLA